MKSLLRYKTILTVFVMALLLTVMSATAEAKTISRKVTEDTQTVSVGSEFNWSGNDVKINGKKISKFKKKIKTVNTGYTDYQNSYRKTGRFDSELAYKSGKSQSDGYKYYGSKYYTFRFLKAGTYKFSRVSYSNYYGGYDVYKMIYKRSSGGVSYYKLQQISYSDENGYAYKDVGTEEYVSRTIDSDEDTSYYTDYTYYQGVTSKKMYAYDTYGITPASFKKGADGKKHMYYDTPVVKTTTVQPYKVVKELTPVTSVQLGKSKVTSKNTSSAYSSTQTYTSKKFLAGKSGKLTVKTGSNYALVDIVVETFDKEGNAIYTLVKNKSKVTYGSYKSGYSYKSSYSTYAYSYQSMYKPTNVYVYCKNKSEKETYIDIESITKDSDGDLVVKYVRVYSDGSKYNGTAYNYLPTSYNTYEYQFYKK